MAETKNTARDITNQLWAMANELRGNMDASEFRNYILGFLFYRYLSENQEAYLKAQDLLDIQAGESVNDAYLREASGDDLNDYLEDIAGSLGYAMPPESTWATIVNKVEQDEIRTSDFQDMFDNFEKNALLNPNSRADFRGIFTDINLGTET